MELFKVVIGRVIVLLRLLIEFLLYYFILMLRCFFMMTGANVILKILHQCFSLFWLSLRRGL